MLTDKYNIPASASIEITAIAKKKNAAGEKVYPLSIGDTHFSPAEVTLKALSKANDSDFHYGSSLGNDKLRESIAKKYNSSYENVFIVPGLKSGIDFSLGAIAGKKVCVISPTWLGYESLAILNNYDFDSVDRYEEGWLDELRNTSFDVLLVCSPNNPDGYIFDKTESNEISKIVKEKEAWIILDEIYDFFSYDQDNTIREAFKDYGKLIIGNGFSKSHSMTGFRIGYVLCSNEEFKKSITLILQNRITCVSGVTQNALVIEDESLSDHLNMIKDYYYENRQLVSEVFEDLEDFKPLGAFYYFIDLRKWGINDAIKFCKDLLESTGIALVPGGAYGGIHTSHVRLSYSVERSVLEEAIKLFKDFVLQYKE